MTSRDDDTLPLPGFCQELSVDVSVDEDFIPTSQPQSLGTSTISKNSETKMSKSPEDFNPSISDSRIDDTLPPEAVMDRLNVEKNKSTDFIPDTETKHSEMNYAKEVMTCKKKLPIFGKEDIFKVESNQSWVADVSKIPETQNSSILEDSPATIPPADKDKMCEESVTEIIVNDSAETVDLEMTSMDIKKTGSNRAVEVSCSSSLDLERCEETQIFDNSSILLLDNQDCTDSDKTESVSGLTSQKLYLQATLDDNSTSKKMNNFNPPVDVAESSKNNEEKNDKPPLGNCFTKPKVQQKINATDIKTGISTRKLQFKLLVTCSVTLDTKTNKVTSKSVREVQEIQKPKPKHVYAEPVSENTTDKSKRQSSSSSGSVYSDKVGPFAIQKRISIKSDQTDSSEDDFPSIILKEKMNHERVPWSYEYLVPLKLDNLLGVAIENQEFLKGSDISPEKSKRPRFNGLQEILESSSSEKTLCNLGSGESQCVKTVQEESSNETVENAETREGNQHAEENQEEDPEGDQQTAEVTRQPQPEESLTEQIDQTTLRVDFPIKFCDGLQVLARWTDKRYYSGVLFGSIKNDRWEVKFDDGASKLTREDFIIPVEWLKVGALVFAMTKDNYVSGQIVEVIKGKEMKYVVELDIENKKISVKLSEICLTEVMAGIIKEKYKPVIETPKAKPDIDFDNVVSGKRFREQRTPLKPLPSARDGNSGTKKKSSSRAKKGNNSVKKTPLEVGSEKKITGLKSENGHLIEDKIISADSQSGAETGETPLRRSSIEMRKKGKPRSLSYESEGTQKKKTKSWLTPDGTPIPGPSGVKTKKKTEKKVKGKAETPADKSEEHSKRSPAAENRKRKRKFEESAEGNIRRKISKKKD